MKYSISILLFFFSAGLLAQGSWQGPSVDFTLGELVIAPSGRHIIHEGGKPFLYLGDTAWELFHRLSREECELYLEDRRSKGFTVIQAVVLAEFDGLNEPNFYGERPLIDNDPTRPNEAYFAHVDWVLSKAEEKGLYIGLLPTWGDKVDAHSWGIGPEIFNAKNANVYGKWIAERYRDRPNIIWINGGDRSGGNEDFETWDALGSAIKKADPGHLMTFHCWGGESSSRWFQEASWLDFNMIQSGHSDRAIKNYLLIEKDRSLFPVKPTMDAEPCYEEHAINWRPEFGYFDAYDVRRQIYWGLLAGSCGATYGAHPVWQFYDEKRQAVTYARMHWKQAIKLPASMQMLHLRRLFESRKWQEMQPANDLLKENPGGSDHMMVLKGDESIIVYAPSCEIIQIQNDRLYAFYTAWWFNPRTGNSSKAEAKVKEGISSFSNEVSGIDWILVIDRSESGLEKPGI